MRVAISLAAAALAACIDDGVHGTPTGSEPDKPMASESDKPVTIEPYSAPGFTEPDVDKCALLLPDDEACAHACEPDALSAYVPAGTCAVFACPLSDGDTLLVGACN